MIPPRGLHITPPGTHNVCYIKFVLYELCVPRDQWAGKGIYLHLVLRIYVLHTCNILSYMYVAVLCTKLFVFKFVRRVLP